MVTPPPTMTTADVERLAAIIVSALQLNGGVPAPFTLLFWLPDGVRHISAGAHKFALIEPLDALLQHWRAEAAKEPPALDVEMPTTLQ